MPSASAACAIASIACASSNAISGFSGLPKLRQSVRPSGSPPAHATLRAAPSTASTPAPTGADSPPRWPPRRDRVPLARRRPRQRNGEAPRRRAQAQHARVEARPAHGARAHELVVLLEDPALGRTVPLAQRLLAGGPRIRLRLLDLVARALVGEERSGDRADDVVGPERAELTVVGDLAD